MIEVSGLPPFRDETAEGWGTQLLWLGRIEKQPQVFRLRYAMLKMTALTWRHSRAERSSLVLVDYSMFPAFHVPEYNWPSPEDRSWMRASALPFCCPVKP